MTPLVAIATIAACIDLACLRAAFWRRIVTKDGKPVSFEINENTVSKLDEVLHLVNEAYANLIPIFEGAMPGAKRP